MTTEEIKSKFKISTELERRGVKLIGKTCCCPFHEDKNPSLSFDDEKGLWNCHGGCGGGDVIRLMARFEGKTDGQLLTELNPKVQPAKVDYKIDRFYQYHDAFGGNAYQVVRMIPKSFRQRWLSQDGKWVWSMTGIERVLYRLPEIIKSQTIWIVEGEKDAETLAAMGFSSTCNVGGAGKWLDAYTDALEGKDVVICGDNDAPGQAHVELVFSSLAGKVATAKIISIPKTFKDVTEYVQSFIEISEAQVVLQKLCDDATPFVRGLKLPLRFMYEIEPLYKQHVRNINSSAFDLGKWLPSLGRECRSLVPGELVLILGQTGIGKTAILSNIAMHASPLKTLFFELELPDVLMYERMLSWQTKFTGPQIEQLYQHDDTLGKDGLKPFSHLCICTEPKLTPEVLEKNILKSELKFGEKAKVVLIDYVQLVQGSGNSRYERTSTIAEDLKVIAKSTSTIIFLASQVSRKKCEDSHEIFMQDGKDSGSLENSTGLLLGAWRDEKSSDIMHIKILKNTKGKSGAVVTCNYTGATHRISECGPIDLRDYKPTHPDP